MEIHKGSLQKSAWMIPEFFSGSGCNKSKHPGFLGVPSTATINQKWSPSKETFATKQATWSQKKNRKNHQKWSSDTSTKQPTSPNQNPRICMATSPGAAGIGRNAAKVGRPKPTSGNITVLGLLTELLGYKEILSWHVLFRRRAWNGSRVRLYIYIYVCTRHIYIYLYYIYIYMINMDKCRNINSEVCINKKQGMISSTLIYINYDVLWCFLGLVGSRVLTLKSYLHIKLSGVLKDWHEGGNTETHRNYV